MSKTVYDQNCCFFEFAILPSFFRLSWQKIWDGFLESWNPSVSKTLQYSMSKSKLAKFYLLAMLKSGILFSKSNILCKYPLQSWCPFLMNTKWQVEKNTNSMHTHTEKKYSQRTHIKTATNKETSSTAAFVLCRFLLPLWLYARSFLYE